MKRIRENIFYKYVFFANGFTIFLTILCSVFLYIVVVESGKDDEVQTIVQEWENCTLLYDKDDDEVYAKCGDEKHTMYRTQRVSLIRQAMLDLPLICQKKIGEVTGSTSIECHLLE